LVGGTYANELSDIDGTQTVPTLPSLLQVFTLADMEAIRT